MQMEGYDTAESMDFHLFKSVSLKEHLDINLAALIILYNFTFGQIHLCCFIVSIYSLNAILRPSLGEINAYIGTKDAWTSGTQETPTETWVTVIQQNQNQHQNEIGLEKYKMQ